MDKQNKPHTHEEIAPLAHAFWENEGRPEGKADEHWQRAEEQLIRNRHRDQESEGDGGPEIPLAP